MNAEFYPEMMSFLAGTNESYISRNVLGSKKNKWESKRGGYSDGRSRKEAAMRKEKLSTSYFSSKYRDLSVNTGYEPEIQEELEDEPIDWIDETALDEAYEKRALEQEKAEMERAVVDPEDLKPNYFKTIPGGFKPKSGKKGSVHASFGSYRAPR